MESCCCCCNDLGLAAGDSEATGFCAYTDAGCKAKIQNDFGTCSDWSVDDQSTCESADCSTEQDDGTTADCVWT